MVTPFDENKELDLPAFRKHVQSLLAGQVEFLVLLGTTGESATVTSAEREKLEEVLQDEVQGRVPLVLGVGGNSTADVVADLKQVNSSLYSAILSVSPYYNKPSQEGLYRHYMTLADNSPLPLILYNVPSRTGSNMEAKTTLRLARDHEQIIAMKEASCNMDQCMALVQERPEDFLILSGDDNYTLPFIALGMEGVISVSANAFPQQFSDMVRHALQGKMEDARALHYKLLPFMRMIFAEGNPPGIKALLEVKGILKNEVRLPLAPVSPQLYQKMQEAWKAL